MRKSRFTEEQIIGILKGTRSRGQGRGAMPAAWAQRDDLARSPLRFAVSRFSSSAESGRDICEATPLSPRVRNFRHRAELAMNLFWAGLLALATLLYVLLDGFDLGPLRSVIDVGALVLTRHFKKYSSKFQRLNELL